MNEIIILLLIVSTSYCKIKKEGGFFTMKWLTEESTIEKRGVITCTLFNCTSNSANCKIRKCSSYNGNCFINY